MRLLEQALKVQEVLDPEEKLKRCDLLLALGWARFYNHEYRHILDNEAPAALALAEGAGDTQRACQACLLATGAIGAAGEGPGFGTAEAIRWTEAFDRYASPNTIERAWADRCSRRNEDSSQRYCRSSGRYCAKVRFWRVSWEMPARLLIAGRIICGFCPPTAEYIEEARQIAGEMRRVWNRADPYCMAYGMICAGSFFLSLGERRQGEAIHRELMESARSARMRARQYAFQHVHACYHIMDGQLEEAAKCHDDVLRVGAEMGAPQAAAVYANCFGPRLSGYLGRGREELRRLDEWAQAAGLSVRAYVRAYYLVCGGEREEVCNYTRRGCRPLCRPAGENQAPLRSPATPAGDGGAGEAYASDGNSLQPACGCRVQDNGRGIIRPVWLAIWVRQPLYWADMKKPASITGKPSRSAPR